jgi:2'-5' RNA ligase
LKGTKEPLRRVDADAGVLEANRDRASVSHGADVQPFRHARLHRTLAVPGKIQEHLNQSVSFSPDER